MNTEDILMRQRAQSLSQHRTTERRSAKEPVASWPRHADVCRIRSVTSHATPSQPDTRGTVMPFWALIARRENRIADHLGGCAHSPITTRALAQLCHQCRVFTAVALSVMFLPTGRPWHATPQPTFARCDYAPTRSTSTKKRLIRMDDMTPQS
jgi:hypothetical protein